MESITIVKKLIERYDYGGAFEVLCDNNLAHTDAAQMINVCRYAVNFDFERAIRLMGELSDSRRHLEATESVHKNLEALIAGEPEALLSELLENVKFQIVNEEYIDFLGRVYRFKEAIYKYMFMKVQLNNRPFTFQNRFLQKKEILKILRNHYKIFNSNLIFALNSYFKKYSKDSSINSVVETMNSIAMNQLIELRHDSIIGHGFKGISEDEIRQVYGDPYVVLDDFRKSIELLGVRVHRYKYSEINTWIVKWLEEAVSID